MASFKSVRAFSWATCVMSLLCAVPFAPTPSSAAEITAQSAEPLSHFPTATVRVHTEGSGREFKVWLATTYERREQGLMFVKHLNPDQGMLFVFETTEPQAFWMKNTVIPLDILYINGSYQVTHIAANATPQSVEPIDSRGPIKWVLELPGGTCAQLHIKEGASVQIKP